MYDLQGLRNRVKAKLDDDAFSNSKLTEFINDTNRFIINAAQWPFMETTQTYTLSVGDSSPGTLPADLQQSISFRITAPDKNAKFIPYLSFRDFDQRYPDPEAATNTTPIVWTVYNDNTIRLYPAPDQAYTAEFRYIKTPSTLASDDDVPDVPSQFEEIMVLGAYKRALEHEDNWDQAQVVGVQFDDLFEKMNIKLSERQAGEQTRMRTNRYRAWKR